jgi:hypothetical protein
MVKRVDPALKRLVAAAEKDPDLLARLCAEPEAIAKEYDVKLSEHEIAQLKRVGELQRIVAEFAEARIPDPIFYPIDVWWGRAIADHVLFYSPIFYPIRYPIIDILRERVGPIFYPFGPPIGYPGPGGWFAAGDLRRRLRRPG